MENALDASIEQAKDPGVEVPVRTNMPAVVVLCTLSLFLAFCGSSSTAPTPSLTPIAVSPNHNIAIPQNNVATGCPLPAADPSAGFGYEIQFEWAPPSTSNRMVSYEIFATKNDAPIPVLDKVVAAGDYTFTQCDAYVVDRNLQGWQWRVRGQDAQGQFTDWSPWAMFQFSQCRLSDGTPCG